MRELDHERGENSSLVHFKTKVGVRGAILRDGIHPILVFLSPAEVNKPKARMSSTSLERREL